MNKLISNEQIEKVDKQLRYFDELVNLFDPIFQCFFASGENIQPRIKSIEETRIFLDSLPLAPEPVKEVLMKMLREIYQAGVNDCITRERVPYLLGEIVAAYHFQVKE
jgi:hypothetical protein